MKLYSWNVNGIRSVMRKDVFVPFIDEHKSDVLCLQETKAQPGDIAIDHPDYTEYWNSAQKKGYSGTALFTKSVPLSVSYHLPDDIITQFDLKADEYGDPNNEGRVTTAEYPKFYLVTVYTPNGKPDMSRIPLRHTKWDPAFLAYLKQLEQTKPVIVCGDLNVAHTEDDLANPKPNKGKTGFTDEERSGFQALIDAGFIDTFRMFTAGNGHYTWWSHFAGSRSRNIGWRIDYFLVSQSLRDRVIAAEIHPNVEGSDHCPVSITLDLED
jgi:exodeoxyribonuclease III